jgi:fibronectin type 3 domain-containing protein
MKFFGVLMFIMLIFTMSFFCIRESFAQTTSENENMQIKQSLSQFPKGAFGFIVWESNRTGQWELYQANVDGSDFRQLTELTKIYPFSYDGYLRARISPDGKTILFNYGKQKAPVEAWVIPSEGGEPRKLTIGASLNWSPDGKIIYFIRDSKIWQYEFDTGKESILYDKQVPVDGRYDVVGDINSNLKSAIFRSEKCNEYFVFDKGETVKTMGGCEPSFSSDGRYLYWVQGPKDFRVWDIENNTEHQFLGVPDYENWNYTYCPRLSRDSRWLTYGASPNQHDHNTSDYEIFIQELKDWQPVGKPIRISQDQKTDRWADIFIHFDSTPPDSPLHVKAEIGGQSIKLSWDAAQDLESKVLWYNIYRSTNKGESQLLAKTEDVAYSDYATDAKTSYQYAICAVNSAKLEGTKSESITITTKDSKPITPINLSITAGNRQARLKWDPNPELDIKGYNIYRSLEPKGKYTKINNKIISEPIYIDDSVEIGKTYYYSITTIDKTKHESPQSVVVSRNILERATDGLLALYLFDEGKGTIVNDSSGFNPPINLHIKDINKVSWVKNENAIEFTGNTMIVSDGNADKLFNNIKGSKELSIEVWFSPSNITQNGPARIVSMSSDTGQRNFTLGQIGEDVAFRLRTIKTDQNGIPELDTQKHILSQKPIHMIATYDGNTKKLYVNGNLHSESQQIIGDFSNWGSYPLVIGNELTGDRSWLGKLFLIGIYNRSLNSEEILRNYQAGL